MTDLNLSAAHREILWNVGSLANVLLFYALFALSSLLCGFGLYRRALLWLGGVPDKTRLNDWNRRFDQLWRNVLKQESVRRDKDAGPFHNLIVSGFVVLLFTTTMVFLDHDLGLEIYRGQFYLVVTVLSDLFGLLLLAGVAKAFHRRYIQRPNRLHSTRADALILITLALLVVQGFLLEGLRIHVTTDPWRHFSFVGHGVSLLFWPISKSAAALLHFIVWWFHSITVFVFIACLPYTKFFHILASSANLFFRQLHRPKGALRHPGDIEKLLEEEGENFRIGVTSLGDLSWKQRLDLDSCTSCGRCQEVCPAYNSGKVLSPKWLILDSRDHMLSLHAKNLLHETASGDPLSSLDSSLLNELLLDHDYSTTDVPKNHQTLLRAKSPAVQTAARAVGRSGEEKFGGEVMDENVFWSCTTCRACMEVCPVGIEHVDFIVDVRRSMALMEGSIPNEAQNSLRAIETRGNPFGPAESRANWTEGLNVPIVPENGSVDVLYWVGCVSAYDKRKQKIARSLASILNASGMSWGILGNREHCTGDPARRLGEENLFQSSAKKNIETLRSITFKTVIANCPHCFNTLKNEYSQIGAIAESKSARVIHHTEFIRELVRENKLRLSPTFSETMTFHDPCYLGRYNDIYDEPRELLVQIGSGELREMRDSGEKGLCCGAGGGHFWMDLKAGERVNVLRTNQAAETGAELIATGCPFCMQMMEDGVKLTNREESLKVRDIAELVAEALLKDAPSETY